MHRYIQYNYRQEKKKINKLELNEEQKFLSVCVGVCVQLLCSFLIHRSQGEVPTLT